jgi:hypothetical protein
MNDHLQDEEAPRARDLEPSEEAVAARFAGLTRHDAPYAVRDAVREAVQMARAGGRLQSSPLGARQFPLGGWGLASAAVLLVALGLGTFIELTDPAATAPLPQAADGAGVSNLTIVEDARMALFHAVETFDDVGLSPGRPIADWGR